MYDEHLGSYPRDVVELIQAIAIEHPTGRFPIGIDAACGTGILLNELVEQGTILQASGFDISRAMLARARARCQGVDLRIGDLRRPPEYRFEAQLITCIFDSLNYLTDPSELATFAAWARRTLGRRGVLVVDVNGPELYEARHGDRVRALIGGIPFSTVVSWDPDSAIAETVITFEDGLERHRQRAWTQSDIEGVLAGAGLSVVDVMDVVGEDDEASGKLVYIARRP